MVAFRLDFVGIGPQRTGTSWLHQMLLRHPQLCFPQDVKETMFFDRHYARGFDWYTAHFAHRQPHQLCGEICPTYFDAEAVPERIRRINPECRVIITLRDPVSRAWSAYRHHLSKGRVSGTFAEAVQKLPQIVEAGRYAQHIPPWIEAFGGDRVAVALLEDIDSRPGRVIQTICSFLGVAEMALPANIHERFSTAGMPRFPWLARLMSAGATWLRSNRLHKLNEWGKAVGLRNVYTGGDEQGLTLDDLSRQRLLEIYAADIVFVERLLKRDLTAWRRGAFAQERYPAGIALSASKEG